MRLEVWPWSKLYGESSVSYLDQSSHSFIRDVWCCAPGVPDQSTNLWLEAWLSWRPAARRTECCRGTGWRYWEPARCWCCRPCAPDPGCARPCRASSSSGASGTLGASRRSTSTDLEGSKWSIKWPIENDKPLCLYLFNRPTLFHFLSQISLAASFACSSVHSKSLVRRKSCVVSWPDKHWCSDCLVAPLRLCKCQAVVSIGPHPHWTWRKRKSKLGCENPIRATALFTLHTPSKAWCTMHQNDTWLRFCHVVRGIARPVWMRPWEQARASHPEAVCARCRFVAFLPTLVFLKTKTEMPCNLPHCDSPILHWSWETGSSVTIPRSSCLICCQWNRGCPYGSSWMMLSEASTTMNRSTNPSHPWEKDQM